MSIHERVLRGTDSMGLQRLLRYYVQRGPLKFGASVGQSAIQRLAGPRLDGYLDRNSLYREELLDTVPQDRIWYYDAPETVEIAEPRSIGPMPAALQDGAGPLHREQPFVCELDDVTLVGPTANPKTSDGRYVRDAQGLSQSQFLQTIVTEKLSAPSRLGGAPAERLETGVLFMHLWSENYFHFMLDFLPRLRGVEEYRRQTGNAPKLIVDADMPGYQREFLERLGYTQEDCYEYDGTRLHVETLVVPYGVRYKPSLIRWLSERLSEGVTAEPGEQQPSRIYISREDALCRRVINEDELMDTLSQEGFVKVVLSEMSIEEQILLFSEVETVVGPHGAGFANLIYAEDPEIIELYGTNPSTFHLTGVLGQPYTCIRTEAVGEDLVVDVDEVKRTLDLVSAEAEGRAAAQPERRDGSGGEEGRTGTETTA